jgi:hypothetical protein
VALARASLLVVLVPACSKSTPPATAMAEDEIRMGRATWAARKATCPAYHYDRS